jgi:hypothetical protein
MPHHAQRVGVLPSQHTQIDFTVRRELMIQADDLPIDFGRQGRFGQSGSDLRSHVARGDGLGL